jgi:CubicO group peptidase (beta-lactamase class C family)
MRDTGLLDDKLAAFIEDVRKRWGVSGLSVSLLDGRSQGFGNPTSGPVTPDTVFCISSNTKLFTAVAIGILVEQGKLSFKTKIKDLFPDFCLDNKHTQEFVTVEDALSHSTGCAAYVPLGSVFSCF